MHELERGDAVGDDPVQPALEPAVGELDDHADVEPPGDLDHVAQRVHEPDIPPQRVRVLDRQPDAPVAGPIAHQVEGGVEGDDAVVEAEGPRGPAGDEEAPGVDVGGDVHRGREHRRVGVPAGRVGEREAPRRDAADGQLALDDAGDGCVETHGGELGEEQPDGLDVQP